MALKETDPALQAATPLLREILGRLTYLQESVSDLQGQIQQSIQQIELALTTRSSS